MSLFGVSSYFAWSQVAAIEAASQDDHGASRLILPAADLSAIVRPGGVSFPATGTLNTSEDSLFSALVLEVMEGDVLLCSQADDVVVFGPGAQHLFDRLAADVH